MLKSITFTTSLKLNHLQYTHTFITRWYLNKVQDIFCSKNKTNKKLPINTIASLQEYSFTFFLKSHMFQYISIHIPSLLSFCLLAEIRMVYPSSQVHSRTPPLPSLPSLAPTCLPRHRADRPRACLPTTTPRALSCPRRTLVSAVPLPSRPRPLPPP